MNRRQAVAALAAGLLLSNSPRASQRFSSGTLAVRVDVLVTEGGFAVLTAAAPKDPREVEAVCVR